MTRSRLVIQSLLHYWRTNLAVLLGVIAGMAVIGGALIVGDSVRASLRKMTLERLGKIDFVLSGSRFFREQLADELGSAPAIVMRAGLQSKSGGGLRRAGQVNVYGFDDRAWRLVENEGVARPTGTQVVLNSLAAEAIQAKVGDEVTVWIELPSAVPRDTLMGKKDNDSQEITLTVSAVAAESTGLAKLGLQPTQAIPLNLFVDLHVLQERLGMEEIRPSRRDPVGQFARVNALFSHDDSAPGGDPRVHGSRMNDSVRRHLSLSDLNLRLIENKTVGGIVVESDQMILEDKFVQAARKTAEEMDLETSPEMVYLANKLWNPAVYQPGRRPGYSMYSTVAGLDIPDLEQTPFAGFEFVGEKPASWGDDDVIVNEFLATDLQTKVGDVIRFSYHVIGSRGELPELERSVTVRGIVKMKGAAVDRTLTPHVKGITDVDSLADWDQPFPMDLHAVTPRDDEYWDSYRAVPKMFMPLHVAQSLWPSRYGSLTSLRVARRERNIDSETVRSMRDEFGTKLLENVNPAELGLEFQPVKAIGLLAAGGSNDFSGLFIGFSLFLIVAAMILIGLLFRLGIEQRVCSLGLMGAVGLTGKQVQPVAARRIDLGHRRRGAWFGSFRRLRQTDDLRIDPLVGRSDRYKEPDSGSPTTQFDSWFLDDCDRCFAVDLVGVGADPEAESSGTTCGRHRTRSRLKNVAATITTRTASRDGKRWACTRFDRDRCAEFAACRRCVFRDWSFTVDCIAIAVVSMASTSRRTCRARSWTVRAGTVGTAQCLSSATANDDDSGDDRHCVISHRHGRRVSSRSHGRTAP